MSKWQYWRGSCTVAERDTATVRAAHRAGQVETVGATQLALMLRARRAGNGSLVLEHGRAGNRERMAARRLVERELLAGPHAVGGGAIGWIYVYTLTERGLHCWLRARS